MKLNIDKSTGSMSYYNVVKVFAPSSVTATGARGSKAKRILVIEDANGDTFAITLFAKQARNLLLITSGR